MTSELLLKSSSSLEKQKDIRSFLGHLTFSMVGTSDLMIRRFATGTETSKTFLGKRGGLTSNDNCVCY